MNVRQIIKLLVSKGYRVTYRERKDGGVRITKINNTSFKGSEGNVEARILTGQTLSERRERQLHSRALLTEKGQWGGARRRGKVPLDKEVTKKLRRVQRLWRKRNIKAGYPSTKNVRYTIREYGETEALRRLEQNERYARGLVYDENIDALINRIEQDKVNAEEEDLRYLDLSIEAIESHRATLKDEVLQKIYDSLYNYEKGVLPPSEFYNQLIQLLK